MKFIKFIFIFIFIIFTLIINGCSKLSNTNFTNKKEFKAPKDFSSYYPNKVTNTSSDTVYDRLFVPTLLGIEKFTIDPTTGLLSRNTTNNYTLFYRPIVKFSVTSDGKFLYVILRRFPDVRQYSINNLTGENSYLSIFSASHTTNDDVGIALTPNDKFLYIALNDPSMPIEMTSIDSTTGQLNSLGTTTFVSPSGGNSIVKNMGASADSNFFYATALDTDNSIEFIVPFSINSTGGLSLIDNNDGISGQTYALKNSGDASQLVYVTTPSHLSFLYTVLSVNSGINIYQVSSGGPLTTLPLFDPGVVGLTAAADPLGNYFYLGDDTGFITTYSINPTDGGLSLASSINTGGASVPSISVTADFKFLNALVRFSPQQSKIYSYPILADGSLDSTNVKMLTLYQCDNCIYGKIITSNVIPFVFISSAISISPFTNREYYSITSLQRNTLTGELSYPSLPLVQNMGQNTALVITSNKKYLYLLNADSDSIYGYSIDPVTTNLTPLSPPSTSANSGGNLAQMVIYKDEFVLVPDTLNGSYIAFVINMDNGRLTPLALAGGFGDSPTYIAIAYTAVADYLYIVDTSNAKINQYQFGEQIASSNSNFGRLGISPLSPSDVNLGSNSPTQLAITPNGKYGYVIDFGNAYIIPVSIDANSGQLSNNGSLVNLAGLGGYSPVQSMISLDSKYLYTYTNNGYLYQFAIGETGLLSALGNPTVDTGKLDNKVVSSLFTPDAKFFYLGFEDGTIQQYSVQSNGELVALNPSSVQADFFVSSMVGF
ncbi:MAG: lactonase family protein [Silvanigrellaceae bacterium]|nr:lactonase family protein [Silvanigrellaceae bacterium]